LMILRTLLFGPSHGHALAKHIRTASEDVLQVETGSLYPALHRLEARGWIEAEWRISDKASGQILPADANGTETAPGEQSKWDELSAAIGRVLRPA